MKALVHKMDQDDVRREYPIADRVAGWFFRLEEKSPSEWVVEGTDLWGRKVAGNGTNEIALLDECCEAARRVNEQISGEKPST
jgi:hypothetical protein